MVRPQHEEEKPAIFKTKDLIIVIMYFLKFPYAAHSWDARKSIIKK